MRIFKAETILVTLKNKLLNRFRNKTVLLGAVAVSTLVACGGFIYTSVGGTATGLVTGSSLTLRNDANFLVNLSEDGPFSFRVASNGSYVISVASQPNPVNCTVANGSGRLTSKEAVTNVRVTCVPNVPLAGNIVGLDDGKPISLANGSLAPETFTVKGAFKFANFVVNGASYSVAVAIQPTAQFCSVANGTGIANNTNLPAAANIAVTCVPAVTIGGTISGLKAGSSVVLTNNATEDLTLSTNTTFAFNTSLLNDVAYDVRVKTQPTGQTCSVTNGVGRAILTTPATPTNILVNCI